MAADIQLLAKPTPTQAEVEGKGGKNHKENTRSARLKCDRGRDISPTGQAVRRDGVTPTETGKQILERHKLWNGADQKG